MAILRELILTVAQLVDLLLGLYTMIIIARALISWVNPDPYNPLVRFLHNATDPVLYRLRRLMPMQFSGIDLSPLVLLLAISFAQRMIKVLLTQLAYSL
ncbi:MAG: YggT family protein [Desulfuromonas sp.]|nr:MAG: YggT family protein [Desulfuromonas sp.]